MYSCVAILGIAVFFSGGTRFTLDYEAGKIGVNTGIDPALPEPILVGVGSDLLSRFVWTVDYAAGVLWIPDHQ
jgi:hypothetical protein